MGEIFLSGKKKDTDELGIVVYVQRKSKRNYDVHYIPLVETVFMVNIYTCHEFDSIKLRSDRDLACATLDLHKVKALTLEELLTHTHPLVRTYASARTTHTVKEILKDGFWLGWPSQEKLKQQMMRSMAAPLIRRGY